MKRKSNELVERLYKRFVRLYEISLEEKTWLIDYIPTMDFFWYGEDILSGEDWFDAMLGLYSTRMIDDVSNLNDRGSEFVERIKQQLHPMVYDYLNKHLLD